MLSATHLVWDAAGRPDPGPAAGAGTCALCGQHNSLHGHFGDNFTDYRLLADPAAAALCAPCTWVLSGRPPNTLRMWTVVVRWDRRVPDPELRTPAEVLAGAPQPRRYAHGPHLHTTNRRDMRHVAHTLAHPPADGSPWLVAVAESGQKHTAPFTAVNHGDQRWTVRLDGADITATPVRWRLLLGHCAALRGAGFPAAEVDTLRPSMNRLKGPAVDLWRRHTQPLAPYRDTPLLHLANLMITKETNEHYVATYPTH